MHRVVLDIPSLSLTLRAEQTFLVLAIAVTVALCVHWGRTFAGVDRGPALRVTAALAFVVLVGARVHYVFNHPDAFAGRPIEALWIFGGPFHLPGGLIAVVLATPWLCRRNGVAAARFGDAITPAIGIGIAITRLGCFLEGCCYGTTCHHAWCLSFPAGSLPYEAQRNLGLLATDADGSLPIHPLQLYFLAAGLLITVVALALERTKRFDGEVTLVGLVLYSASSAALEFLRADTSTRTYWGPLPQLAWTGLAVLAATLATLVVAEVRHARAARTARPWLVSGSLD